MQMTGAKILMECLLEQHVDTIFGYPGGTILNVYEEGRLPLYHFDWYRLESAEELYEMGMDEYLGGDGVAVVEWPSQCPEAIPETHLAVHLTPVGDSERDVTFTPDGGVS